MIVRMLRRSHVALSLVVGICGLMPIRAQVTTATFYGIVNDPTGAPVPGATVRLTDEDTSTSTTKTTDAAGEFTFDFLQVGAYTLNIQAAGFKAYRSTGIRLAAAQNVRQTFGLELGTISDTVEVVGETPQLNTVAADQRESRSQLEVANLPTAQRNFVSLLNIGTGVQTTGDGGVRMNGLGRSGLKITVDGTDASSSPETPSTALKNNFNYINVMSLESIQDVQTTKGVSAAEYGFQLAGNVNLIAKSGTNQWHGSLFENYETQHLNATDRSIGTKTNFNFNQFGGSIGGPIKRNKIFIFGVFEGYRQSSYNSILGDVPSQTLRNMAIAAVPAYKGFLDTLYLPNQPLASPSSLTGIYKGAGKDTRSDNHVDVKGDWHVTDGSNLSLTYSHGRPFLNTPAGRTQIGNNQNFKGIQERGTAEYVMGGASWSSETRFGYNYVDVERLDEYFDVLGSTPETTPGGRRAPSMAVNGLFGNGGGSEDLNIYGPTWSLEEKYSKQWGQHSLKFGGIYNSRGTGRFDVQNVAFNYANLQDFLANIPNSVAATFGNNRFRGHSFEIGAFLQDDWRISPKLVLNLGLRYDFFSKFTAHGTDPAAPAALYNLNGLIDSSFHFGGVRDPNDPINNDSAINLGPRVGFAYSIGAKNQTVIRGGFGVMFAPQPWDDYDRAVSTSPYLPSRVTYSRSDAVRSGLGFPQYNDGIRPLVQASGTLQVSYVFDPNIQSPYAMQTYFGIQHSITQRLMIESAYVGTRGNKFRLSRLYNTPDRVTDVRPNASLPQGNYYCACQNTEYNSWQTSLRQQLSNHLTFNVHYTWSKTLAPAGGDTGADFTGDTTNAIQDFFNVDVNRGPASGDTTHVIAADWVYQLPSSVPVGNAILRTLLGGWQLSGIFNARSGQPVYVSQTGLISRPDYIGGNAIEPDYNQTGIYLNPAAFKLVPVGAGGNPIRPGDLGNNAIRGPAFWGIDASVGRNFRITERIRFQLRADLFNLLNHAAYHDFTAGINSAHFGRFTDFYPSRQMQLTGRLTW
jgi:outer membrane receptor protein involved in Fe transport